MLAMRVGDWSPPPTRTPSLLVELEQVPGRHRGPGVVREDAVDAQPVELQVLLERVVAVVGQKVPLLVTARPGVDLQPVRMRTLDQVRRRERLAVGLVIDDAVAVLVV